MESSQNPQGLPSIFVLGSNIAEALDLAKSIYLKSFIEKNEHLYNSLCHNVLGLKPEAPFLLEKYLLDTNYYDCEIKIACSTYDHIIAKLETQDIKNFLQENDISSVEGLVFVSSLKGNKREGVERYLKYHKEIVDQLTPELLMCFANTNLESQEDLFETFKFGENELFVEIINDDLEFIEPKRPDPSVPKPKFEEKNGVERIVENLECHMWPNMVKKGSVKKGQSVENVPVVQKKEEVKVDDDEEEDERAQYKPLSDGPAEEKVTSEKEPVENKEDNKEAPKEVEKKEAPVKPEDKQEEKPKQKTENPLDSLDIDEKEMEDIAALFETVRQFKMNSKHLSDKDRRDQAADLLMKLVANCKELQEEFDDEDDEENEGVGSK